METLNVLLKTFREVVDKPFARLFPPVPSQEDLFANFPHAGNCLPTTQLLPSQKTLEFGASHPFAPSLDGLVFYFLTCPECGVSERSRKPE